MAEETGKIVLIGLNAVTPTARERILQSYEAHYNEAHVRATMTAIVDQIRHDTEALHNIDFKTACDIMESWCSNSSNSMLQTRRGRASVIDVDDLKTIRECSRRAINSCPDSMDKLVAIGMLIHASYHLTILTKDTGIDSDIDNHWIEGKECAQQIFYQYISKFKSLHSAAHEETKGNLFGALSFRDKDKRRLLLLQFVRISYMLYGYYPRSSNGLHPSFPAIEEGASQVLTNKDFNMWAPSMPIIMEPYCRGTLSGHLESVQCCAAFGGDDQFVSGSSDRTLRVWNLGTGQCTISLSGHSNVVSCCAVFNEGRQLISGSYDYTIKVWNLDTGRCTHTLKGHSEYVRCCAVFRDDQQLVSGSYDKSLKVWNVRTGQCTRTLIGHSHAVNCCTVFDGDRRVVSGSVDNTLKVWDLGTGRCICTLTGHSNAVICCTVFDEDRQLVSGSSDNTLKLWNLSTGQCTLTLTGHSQAVICCAIFNDNRQLVSGSSDGTLKVWDLVTGQCTRSFTGYSGSVLGCAVLDEDRQLVSGCSDGTLHVWDISSITTF